MAREDGRNPSQMRPTRIVRNYIKHPEGSVLIAVGDTKVVCTASVEESQPRFMREQHLRNRGWVTAEYSMLPRSTSDRMRREVTRGSLGGRTQEIQRLIGRSLRAVVDLKALGERTIWIDCDVIQADGGTTHRINYRRIYCALGCLSMADGSKADNNGPNHRACSSDQCGNY